MSLSPGSQEINKMMALVTPPNSLEDSTHVIARLMTGRDLKPSPQMPNIAPDRLAFFAAFYP